MRKLCCALCCCCLLLLPVSARDKRGSAYLYSRTSFSAFSILIFNAPLTDNLTLTLLSEWENSPGSTLRINGRLKKRIWQWNQLSLYGTTGLDSLILPGKNSALGGQLGGIFQSEFSNWLDLNASFFTTIFQDDFTLEATLGAALKLAVRVPFGLRFTSLPKNLALYSGVSKEW